MKREVTIKITEEIENINESCSVNESAILVKDRIKYNFSSCEVEIINAEDVEN